MEKNQELESDIISNLPENILEKVLMYLPIKDAVKTSLLARNWRYTWVSIPELVFDHRDFFQKATIKNFVPFIDKVLSSHRGPIQKFELSISNPAKHSLIDSWMEILSRHHLKNFKLKILFVDEYYKIPSTVFSFQELTFLELYKCELKPPATFKGFRNLKILRLCNVQFSNEEDIFENMISSCPVLEEFSLKNFRGETCLKIRAPNLLRLSLNGYFLHIFIVDAPKLTHTLIILKSSIKRDKRDKITSDLLRSLDHLAGVEKFVMYGEFLKLLTKCNLPSYFQFPVSFNCLKKLSLEVNFNNLNVISVTTSLLKSSPNLQKLKILARAEPSTAFLDEDFWEAHGKWDCSMSHLIVVEINGILSLKTILEFIKFLFANSHSLKLLSLTPCFEPGFNKAKVAIELLRFEFPSSNAEIRFNSDKLLRNSFNASKGNV